MLIIAQQAAKPFQLGPRLGTLMQLLARGLTSEHVTGKLLTSDQPIHVQRTGKGELTISVWMMRGNEHEIVGRRLHEIFSV